MRRPDGASPLQDAEHALHPWVTFLILPTFAFANAGVSFAGATWSTLAESVTLGIAAGLVAGKALGIFGSTWLMVRAGWAELPGDSTWTQLFGVSLVCGIGFTMSLFIGGLAFEGQAPGYEQQVKLGVLFGSLVAGTLGSIVLARAAPRAQ